MDQTAPLFPRLTRQERHRLNQVIWARRILREAPADLLQRADMIEQLRVQADLPERGAHHAAPKRGQMA
jgi:hypothetical protein